MSQFHRFAQRWLPWWLLTGDGGKVVDSLMQVLETFRVRVKTGLLARFPEWAAYYVDDAALAAIGRDRKIVRGINEPAVSYAKRLVRAIDDHRRRGNFFAMLAQIQAYLQANCRVRIVDRRGNWWTREADGTETTLLKTGNWDWDGRPASPEWARFWVIIFPEDGIKPWRPSGLWGDATLWGDGLWGHTDKCIGLTATPDQMATLKSIIRDWKPGGTTCEWVIVAFDPDTFDPAISMDLNGEWGTWGNHTGGPVRLETARYMAVGATK